MKILDLAMAETSPEQYHKFLPITRGPIVAVIGLVFLGLASGFYLVFDWMFQLIRRPWKT